VGLSSAVRDTGSVLFESDMQRGVQWTSHLKPRHLAMAMAKMGSSQSSRSVSAVPIRPKTKPPTLEEFDPLNPGEWQVGAGGKILPRLPEGTRVGSLMMGKYGLYDPKVRKRQEGFAKGLAEGKWSEHATPFETRMSYIAYFLGSCAMVLTAWNYWVLVSGQPQWPMTTATKVHPTATVDG